MTLNTGLLDFYIRYNGAGRTVGFRLSPDTRYVTVVNSCTGGAKNEVVLDRAAGANRIALRGTANATNIVPLQTPIHDPALYAAAVLAETLSAQGIAFSGGVGRDAEARSQLLANSSDIRVLAMHESTLQQVVSHANKDSQNIYAESLCKRLGYAATGQSGTWASGTAAVGSFLKKAGAADGSFALRDGCGLSRRNVVSAATIAAVLEYDFRSAYREQYIQTLAIAGQDGTLEERFPGRTAPLRGRVHAKTGYIATVSALSGYLRARDDRWYAFSILFNGIPAGTNGRAKELQEELVLALDRASER
jgi:D-alanyl-D-alanine carboxypeptidase/D-alanyl-D-alanine-endopeptidase (penicillin-binding protein 4)